MKIIKLYLILIILYSCIKESPLPLPEKKIVSFYTDYYIYLNHYENLNQYSQEMITDFVLKKNKLNKTDLKNITFYFQKNPIAFKNILQKTKIKVDSIFSKSKSKK